MRILVYPTEILSTLVFTEVRYIPVINDYLAAPLGGIYTGDDIE